MAEVTGQRAVITTPTCPLRPLVRARPRLAGLDRGMWIALVAQALTGGRLDQLACETRDCQGDHADCRVLLTLGVRDA